MYTDATSRRQDEERLYEQLMVGSDVYWNTDSGQIEPVLD